MDETTARFKKKAPRKKEPVTRITLSAEDRRIYENLAEKRAERDRAYERHLGPASRVK